MEKQRLDKIIASTGKWSRREVKSLIRHGQVLVDGLPAAGPEERRTRRRRRSWSTGSG